ncbi:uncharacterized protein LOC113236727 [Hyposmocoma kahamanoa]|uniref:uncharacterized protein LOC113236727 n=1 Tax=Hyposmocoma kahamanoa TaxID=1477025 RepID=UPI000E6D84A2|nr:uncharacterized protein LOC113236727 [Hyposmocoma kahamanoa]
MSDSEDYHSCISSDSFISLDASEMEVEALGVELSNIFGTSSQHFNICHINAQSIPRHYTELLDTFSSSSLHAVLVTESWFKPCHNSTTYALPGYILVRNDRPLVNGGGVAIYISSSVPFKTISASEYVNVNDIEYIFLEIVVSGVKAILGVVYCPRPVNSVTLTSLTSVLDPLATDYSHLVIMGDLNTDLLQDSLASRNLRSTIESFSLSILEFNATHHNIHTEDTWIDQAIVSSPNRVVKHGQVPAPGFSHHDLLYVVYKIKPHKRSSEIKKLRNFAGLELNKLAHDASTIDWSGVLATSTVDGKVANFGATLLSLYDKHAPIRLVKLKRPPAPWITPLVRIAMRRRDGAFRKFKRCRSEENWTAFKLCRNRCNQMVRAAKRRNFHDNLVQSSPAATWKFLKSVGLLKPQNDAIPHSFTLDDISRQMIVCCLDSVLPIITHIINCSLSSGTFPSSWRRAYVLPLPKINNPSVLKHFRPISILPFLSKILEAVVHRQLSSFLFRHNVLGQYQSGFRPGHSTTTALLKVTEDIREGMEASRLTALVLIDFSNAFNAVDHDILLAILAFLRVSALELEWFSSYHKGRKQAVRAKDVLSNCSHHLYADDLQIYAQAKFDSLDDAICNLNDDLRRIADWSSKFGISVNPSKCQGMIVGSPYALSRQYDSGTLSHPIFKVRQINSHLSS